MTKSLALASVLVLAFLTSCATTSFYVPQDTELTISIRHSSDIGNFELKGMSTLASTVDAQLIDSDATKGQWMEPNHGILRSAQWGPDVPKGDSVLKAVWHVTLSPAPGQGPTELVLSYTKGDWGDLDITIEGPGDNRKPFKISRHYSKGAAEHSGNIYFKTSDVLKDDK